MSRIIELYDPRPRVAYGMGFAPPCRTMAELPAELRARVAAARGIVGDGDAGSAGQEGEAR